MKYFFKIKSILIFIFIIFFVFISSIYIVFATRLDGMPSSVTDQWEDASGQMINYNPNNPGEVNIYHPDYDTIQQANQAAENRALTAEFKQKNCYPAGECKDSCEEVYDIDLGTKNQIGEDWNDCLGRYCCRPVCKSKGGTCKTACSSSEKVVPNAPCKNAVCCSSIPQDEIGTPLTMFYPEVPFPGFENGVPITSTIFQKYISAIYDYMLYVAGVLAVIMIMVGGFQWVSAGGNESKIGQAKERITSAIIGLLLAVGSYVILNTINPDLVINNSFELLKNIDPVPLAFDDDPANWGDVNCVNEINDAQTAYIPSPSIIKKSFAQTCRGGTCSRPELVTITAPIEGGMTSFQVNSLIANDVINMLNELRSQGVRFKSIYGWRGLANGANCVKSKHGQGLAIDFNTDDNFQFHVSGGSQKIIDGNGNTVYENAYFEDVWGNFWAPANLDKSQWRFKTYGRASRNKTSSPYSLHPNGPTVTLFKTNGWCWGGDFGNPKDYMHFSYAIPGRSDGFGYSECR